MAIVDLVMPKMGESIMEATVLKWLKKPGDPVKEDETVLEIATDKVDSEVPSTSEGVIEEILFEVNDVVPVGAVIAKIRTEKNEQVHPGTRLQPPGPGNQETKPAVNLYPPGSPRPSNHQQPQQVNKFYSPLVLNIASSEGISMAELESIPGTGNEGRVTKKDILQFVADRKNGKEISRPQEKQAAPVYQQQEIRRQEPPEQPAGTQAGNVEIMEMDRMRKLIADHMVRSKQTSPHVTSFSEADVTNLVLWREKVKGAFEKRENTKLTFTPLFIEAIVRCIKKYPLMNSSLENDRIIIKKDINIGMATALPNGNLIVPVIRNADQFNLVGLARQVNNLADNARNNKLRPEETQAGTFTITNVGTFGSLMGTPIINQPQVAILAVGAIKKRPMVVETSQGDSIAIRHMMYLSMSYDHRIIDGSLGATFLTAVARELENFDPAREI
jgi:2-oxoglutarate dehydrogenase E2 component (dihydrolipoamide succinyltransferase)